MTRLGEGDLCSHRRRRSPRGSGQALAPGFWMVAVEQAVIRQVPGESLASDRSARNSVGTT
jgi:hypothetical protein